METKRDTFTITWSAIAAITLLVIILSSCAQTFYTLEGEKIKVQPIGEVPDCDTLVLDNGLIVTKTH